MPWVAYAYPQITGTQFNTQIVTIQTCGTHIYPLWVNSSNALQTGVIYPQTGSAYYWVNEPANLYNYPRPEHERPTTRSYAQPRRESAQDRAMELLLSHLDDVQKVTLKDNGYFDIVGGRSRMRYRIHTHHLVANVTRLDDAQRLCAHCDPSLPMNDNFLAQKLIIENDEDTFLRIANRH